LFATFFGVVSLAACLNADPAIGLLDGSRRRRLALVALSLKVSAVWLIDGEVVILLEGRIPPN